MYAHHLKLVLQHVAVMWVLTVMGLVLAGFLPGYLVISFAILAIILQVLFFFVRTIQIADYILLSIPFFNGILLFWIAHFFFELLGKTFIFTLIIGMAVIWIILAFLGMKLTREFPEWGTYGVASFVVILVYFLSFQFFSIESIMLFMIVAIFVYMITLYAVYEFNCIRKYSVRHHEIVMVAFNMYLGFINIFFVLRNVIGRRWKISQCGEIFCFIGKFHDSIYFQGWWFIHPGWVFKIWKLCEQKALVKVLSFSNPMEWRKYS